MRFISGRSHRSILERRILGEPTRLAFDVIVTSSWGAREAVDEDIFKYNSIKSRAGTFQAAGHG